MSIQETTAPGNGAAIVAEGLVKEFKNGPRAVDGIDLRVETGEIYGFLGPNGAGKSTAVLMLTTLLPVTEGRAWVGGFDVSRQGAQVRASIGAALQEAALDPNLTAREHMRLQTTLQGVPKTDRRRLGDELIERVGLSDAADRKAGTYSGGMRRRLDLALSLVHGPSILFLDEPTTGLDPQSRSALWEEVARLAREDGTTIFLTTQYLEEADELADRVGIIDDGKIVAEGTPAALKSEIGLPTVEVTPERAEDRARVIEALRGDCEIGDGAVHYGVSGDANTGTVSGRLRATRGLADVVRALDAAGLAVANLSVNAPTLDDVFLAKTGRKLEGAGDQTEDEHGHGHGHEGHSH
ncbi:MAG: ATP-binding cassette domain-containing protein [Actinobacteria bacterium]|nr:ATP-binding cassette domain-containing protein [Actinomycetota bacterium]